MRNIDGRAVSRPKRCAIPRVCAGCALTVILVGGSSALAEEQTQTPADAAQAPQADLTQLSFEDLSKVKVDAVYAASRRLQKVTEAPASVSLVTSDEIKFYGYRTLADILRSVRGVDVSSDRNYGYIGIRGFNRPGDFGGRVLIMVDGHRLNEPIYDSAFNLMEFILDVDLIERVEVVRGPGSVIYGNNAFFGVVNVVTRRGRDFLGGEVSGSYASYDTYNGRISYGNIFKNGVEFTVSGSIYDSAGHGDLYYPEFDDPQENFGVAHRVDGERAYSAFASLSYNDFTLESGYVWRKKDVPTASFDTIFNDPRYNTIDNRSFVSLKYAKDFGDDFSLMGRVYYDYYGFSALYPVATDTGSILNKDEVNADWAGAEIQANKRFGERNNVTAGAEYRYDFELQQLNYDIDPPQEYLNSNPSQWRLGVYAQDEITLLKSLTLTLGLRYDHYSTFGDTVNPRAGLVYEPIQNTIFKLLYGEAYRAPNANETYYVSPTSKANLDLGPEKVRTYEAILEQYFGKSYRASVGAFYVDTRDLISQEIDPVDNLLVYQNRDQVSSTGGEGEFEAKWDNGVRARVSYTYQQTHDQVSGTELSNSPRHLGKVNFTVPIYRQMLFAGLEVQASSSRLTLAGNQTGEFGVVNLTLYAREIVKGLDLSASLYNLLDEHYYYSGSGEHRQDMIQMDGRNFRVKLTYRF
jgi:outer membrane receptor for ferrienterochelin and colicins